VWHKKGEVMKLIARWKIDEGDLFENPKDLVELPDSIEWEDGTPATAEEFIVNLDCTTEWLYTYGYREARIYPGAYAILKFEDSLGQWIVGGDTLPITILDNSNPNATKAELDYEMTLLDIEYRYEIVF
jgi:hypothetical protein